MVTINTTEGIVSNLVAKALQYLGEAAIREAASLWGAKDDLNEVEKTLRMIQAGVRDAERHQEEPRNELIKKWLRRLKQVLYQADDLCDEVFTLDCQKQQMERSILGKVGILFSKYVPLYCNRELADEIKCVRKELDAVKSEMAGLGFSILLHADELSVACSMEEKEITSFANITGVIGRENDASMIIEMLVDPTYDGEKLAVIPIVGFGGLGKTTLAQLIFNNNKIGKHFDLTRWTYVPEKNNHTVIVGKIFSSFTGKNYHNYQLEYIQQGIRESIATKKYLLVLDDLCYEEVDRLNDLVSLLRCGKQGSKVIITTRSLVVAKGIGTIKVPHELETLTDGQSWSLFKRMAFKPGHEDNNHALITIGKEIVKMCENVPLVIKVVGGSLRSEDREQAWLQVRETLRSKAQLTKGDGIMFVLKISYDYLPPALKQCFAYCSLFPKGSWFEKNNLVQLWMAQGYLKPYTEDIGDQYVSNLLERNFFQNPEVSAEGNVERFKIHDLLHDLAHEVAGDEVMVLVDESPIRISEELVHVSVNGSTCPPSLLLAKKMRSLLCVSSHAFPEGLIVRFRSLRVLSVECITNMELPTSIGGLIHLRYLKFGENAIKNLPDSITRLGNLQTLNLESCSLEQLPREFANLISLRHLLIDWKRFIDLPSGFENMTSLRVLEGFIVGKNNGIDSLPALNLRGKLNVKFREWRRNTIMEVKRANLKNNYQLTSLTLELDFEKEEVVTTNADMNKILMCLQLPPNLKNLEIRRYKGDEMPSRWLDELSKLVSISITQCEKCKVLPHLSQLPHLKSLELCNLNDLEYAEDENNIRVSTADAAHNVYFPSLEILKLDSLFQLKGWTRPSKGDSEQSQLVFPSLLELKVHRCPMLTSMMPLAPKLESLRVFRTNWKVFESNLMSTIEKEVRSSSSTPSSSAPYTSLKNLGIYLVNDDIDLLSISSKFSNLNELSIVNCIQLKSLRIESPNSIKKFHIEGCNGLRNISEGLQHLSVLEKLGIYHCEELEMDKDELEEGKSSKGWQGLSSLRELSLWGLPQMKTLPQGIARLTALQQLYVGQMKNLTELPEEIGNLSLLRRLHIEYCPKFKSLPTTTLGLTMLEELSLWRMENLTDLPLPEDSANLSILNTLNIQYCPRLKSIPTSLLRLTTLQGLYIKHCVDLTKRYKKPDGEDCHLIQHITFVQIR